MTTLAVDIGGTKLAAALLDDQLRITTRRELATPASRTAQALTEALQALLAPLAAEATQVAIASTGIIRNGILTAINPDNLGGLASFPLLDIVSRISGLPGIALNDAQAATWAEYCALDRDRAKSQAPETVDAGGNAQDKRVDDMVFITVSTGVGGGIVSGGKLLSGHDGLAGHLGHTLADPNGPRCGCGRIGCVEAVASGRAIAAAARDELSGLDAKAIFALAREGHQQATMLVQRSARALARMIADIKAVTDCQQVVVGGSVGLAEGYLDLVEAYLLQEPAAYSVPLSTAHYRHDAGLVGAALILRG